MSSEPDLGAQMKCNAEAGEPGKKALRPAREKLHSTAAGLLVGSVVVRGWC